jgi:hypothetical protein
MKESDMPITGELNALTYAMKFSISLRDLFAAAAYGAVIQNAYPHASEYKANAARIAYEFADAALAVRSELETPGETVCAGLKATANENCICPIVVVTLTNENHVSASQLKSIADSLNASVSLGLGGMMRSALYGKHRPDCPASKLRLEAASKGDRNG